MEAGKAQSRRPSWVRTALIGRNPKRTLARAVVLAGVCVVVFNFVLLPIHIEGVSMLPTYKENRVNFVNRLAYALHGPRRGDVVAVRHSGHHVMLMKRIIGMPGETVAFHQGRALVNGKVLDEPYVKLPCDWDLAPEEVGPDQYYVVGDNRSMAEEGHVKGRATRDGHSTERGDNGWDVESDDNQAVDQPDPGA